MLNTPLEFNYETALYFLHIHMHMRWRHLSINISFPYDSIQLACSKCGGLHRWLLTLCSYKYSDVNRYLQIYVCWNVLGCSNCGDFRMFLNIAPSVLKKKTKDVLSDCRSLLYTIPSGSLWRAAIRNLHARCSHALTDLRRNMAEWHPHMESFLDRDLPLQLSACA